MDKKKIGLFIAELRREKDLTQKQLADMLFISDKAISKWECGIASPDTSCLLPLSKILGVTVTELLNGERLEHVSGKDVDAALTLSLADYQHNKKLISISQTRFTIVLIIAVIIIGACFIWAHIRISQFTEINEYLFLMETVMSPDDINKYINEFNGTIDVKSYVRLREDFFILRNMVFTFPLSRIVGKNYDEISDSCYAAGRSMLSVSAASYSEIDNNFVIFDDAAQSTFIESLRYAETKYSIFLNQLYEIKESYRNNLIIKMYLYIL